MHKILIHFTSHIKLPFQTQNIPHIHYELNLFLTMMPSPLDNNIMISSSSSSSPLSSFLTSLCSENKARNCVLVSDNARIEKPIMESLHDSLTSLESIDFTATSCPVIESQQNKERIQIKKHARWEDDLIYSSPTVPTTSTTKKQQQKRRPPPEGRIYRSASIDSSDTNLKRMFEQDQEHFRRRRNIAPSCPRRKQSDEDMGAIIKAYHQQIAPAESTIDDQDNDACTSTRRRRSSVKIHTSCEKLLNKI